MSATHAASPQQPPGYAARRIAADILTGVLLRKRPFDELLETSGIGSLPERDRALVRAIAAMVLRRLGTLRQLLMPMMERGVPREVPQLEPIILVGAAQILFLGVPDHAAVDLSVRLAQSTRHTARYAGLVNAVLRRTAREGKAKLAGLDTAMLDAPDWLTRRWIDNYGEATASAIAAAHAREPALDLTVKQTPEHWAAQFNGRVLPTGTVRIAAPGPVAQLAGFNEGEWWVQDAAAAIPARLLGDVRGLSVADLCAAPGGKTAQLAHAGANVTAVDRSPARLARLRQNLMRLGLQAETVEADAAQWQAGPFDAVLLDAPCSSTGTVRRHPDIPWLKSETDLTKLAAVQARLLDHAATLVRPGGTLIYCTCSLEPEEGEHAVAAFLGRNAALQRRPIDAAEFQGIEGLVSPEGDLRTLPCHWPDDDPRMAGLDGFFAARIVRIEST